MVPGGISEKKIFRRRLESLSGFLESTALRGCPAFFFPLLDRLIDHANALAQGFHRKP